MRQRSYNRLFAGFFIFLIFTTASYRASNLFKNVNSESLRESRLAPYDCRNSIKLQSLYDAFYNSLQTEPPISVEITNPLQDEFVSSTVNITVNAQASSGVSNVSFYIDSQLMFNDAELPYEWEWNTRDYDETEHNITVIAYDTLDNSATASITVYVDYTLPAVLILQPSLEKAYSGNLTVIARVMDNREVASVYIKLGDIDWTEMTYNFTMDLWYYELDTTAFFDQQHLLMVKALDKAGNSFIAISTVFTDNNPPTVSFQNLENGTIVSSNFTVSMQADDVSGISKIEFYIQDTLIYTDFKAPYEWLWDTKEYENGEYAILAKAFDSANHTQTCTVTVTVENVEPWWQSHFWILVLGLACAGGLIFIVSVLLIKRRNAHKVMPSN